MGKRRKRSNNFFMAILVMLVIKIFIAKIDIFGVASIMTGFSDILIIWIASYIISSLSTKGRLLAYSIFSFCMGLIIVLFKIRVQSLNHALTPFLAIYFLDSLFIFSIFMLVRNQKKRKREIIPKHPGFVYMLLLLFGILSAFNIVSAKSSTLDAYGKAKKIGIFAFSISNPTISIKADSITTEKTVVVKAEVPKSIALNQPKPKAFNLFNLTSRGTSSNGLPQIKLGKQYTGLAKGKNVIVIQFESLQNLAVNRTFNGVEITPNLNKLIKDSVYFENGISQISKGTTSDAEFAFNTSCYPINNAAAFETIADRKYVGLPYLMSKAGYFSCTFHTNTATFWNRSKMYPQLGWNKWYDKPFFGQDYRAGYGSADYLLFKKALPELVKFKESAKPFFAQLITVSSHNPYTIPAWMRTVHFGANVDNTYVGRYLRTINYADRQIGMFMEDLKASGLYEDSLIILYGDHFGLGEKNMTKYGLKSNLAVIKAILGRPYDKLDMINVPILFKLPGEEGAKTVSMPAGQIDIMPTILNLVGEVNSEGKMFGSDLMNITANQVGVRYYLPSGSFADNNQLSVGREYTIDYSHQVTKLNQPEPVKQTVDTKIVQSDEYIKSLKKK